MRVLQRKSNLTIDIKKEAGIYTRFFFDLTIQIHQFGDDLCHQGSAFSADSTAAEQLLNTLNSVLYILDILQLEQGMLDILQIDLLTVANQYIFVKIQRHNQTFF